MNDAKSSMVIQDLENKLKKKDKEAKELKKEIEYYHDTMIEKKTVMEYVKETVKKHLVDTMEKELQEVLLDEFTKLFENQETVLRAKLVDVFTKDMEEIAEKLKRLVKEKDEKLKRVVKEKDEKLKRVVKEKDKEMKRVVKENDEKLKRVVKEKERELIKRFEEFSDDGTMIRIEKLEETNVLWNFEQGREASKEEVIQYLLKLNKNYQLLKTHVDLFCCCA